VLRPALQPALALIWAAISAAAAAAEIAAPYVPTAPSVVERMLEVAKVGPDDYVIDLGSGDGRINILAAKKYGARGHGIEIDNELIARANENARAAGVSDRVSFVQTDLFTADLSKASVVTIYLLKRATMKLRDALYSLAPGTRIISHAASMGEWKADHFEILEVKDKVRADAPNKTYLHYWVVPAKVAGTWTWSEESASGPRDCELELSQHFQMLVGNLKCGAENAALLEGKLTGARLALELGARAGAQPLRRRFEAEVAADALNGSVRIVDAPADEATPWRAARTAAQR